MTAEASLQWKGTKVCLDFTCECGATGHLDSYFAYVIMCPMCGRKYGLYHVIGLIDLSRDTKTINYLGRKAFLKAEDFAIEYHKNTPKLISHIKCPECGDINSQWKLIDITHYELVCMHGHHILGWPDPLPEWLSNEIIENGQAT